MRKRKPPGFHTTTFLDRIRCAEAILLILVIFGLAGIAYLILKRLSEAVKSLYYVIRGLAASVYILFLTLIYGNPQDD